MTDSDSVCTLVLGDLYAVIASHLINALHFVRLYVRRYAFGSCCAA